MSDFLNYIFSAPNIIPTFLLCFCVVYWLIVMIGIIDLDMIDVDVEVEADVETDVTGGTEVGVAWFNKVLYFFNLGRFPFMIWLSIVGLMAWFGTIMINRLIHVDSFIIGTGFFIIAFIGGMIIAKPLTFPLVKMFDSMEKSDGLKSVVGQLAEVLYPNKGKIPGEVEINFEGSRIRIFAVPSSKEIVLIKNQKVLVIAPTDHDPKIFLVEPYK